MKANELMIGDWVMVYPWDETPWKPKKITDINFHSWEGADFCDSVGVEGWDELSLDQIKPILLTPEILARMGFTVEEESKYDDAYTESEYTATMKCVDVRKCNVEIEYKTYRNEITVFIHDRRNILQYRSIETQVGYVHELQHIMRLLGIEKEIIL
jgi:hypothetical protein